MPESTARGIDVSKEEEQYLRSAFRRFALPYVLLFAGVAWATTSWLSNDPPAPGSSAEVAALRDQVAALEQTVAKLDARLSKVGTDVERAGSRVGALESRKPAERASSDDTDGLERSLREATRRIAELERRNGSGATSAERIDALTARMQRLEGATRAQASAPAPAAPGAPPALPAAPAPPPAP
jgi:hypothetical protein